jgi:hypothetical protein
MDKGKNAEDKGISRRRILAGAGMLTASAALAGFGVWPQSAVAKSGSTEKWPWPYVKLDPEKTAELAYDEWHRVFCGAGVISTFSVNYGKKLVNLTP